MKNSNLALTVFAALALCAASNTRAAIVTTLSPVIATQDVSGLSFVSTVNDFTTPYPDSATSGVEFAISGPPDHPVGNEFPMGPTIVDFGGNGSGAWTVDLGFPSAFTDGIGADARVFGTQLNVGEDFEILASADDVSYASLGFFTATDYAGTFYVDIDFNGSLASPARFLRFTGPVTGFAAGFDFDAVGVTHPVPLPPSVLLLASAFGLGRAATRCRST